MRDWIQSDRLLLRCWQPADAPLLREAIDASLTELQMWVPWALEEPSPSAVLEDRLRGMQAKFASGEDWAFAVFDAAGTRLLGGAGLHPRGTTDHLEIGYWIRTEATGQGFALEAAATLCRVAFADTAFDRLEIHCDANNGRSAGVARRLGFALSRTFRQPAVTRQGTERDTLVWMLLRSDFDAAVEEVSRTRGRHGHWRPG